MKTLKFSGLLLLGMGMLMLLAACGPEASLDDPPVIRIGEDICDECNMIIDDARFAASYVTKAGDVRRFDDIGDILVYDIKHQEDVHIYWVHDYESEEWVNAEKAVFVLSPNLTTPMGWGLAAFTDTVGAESFITNNGGSTTSFAELLQDVESGSLNPEMLRDHSHDEAETVYEDKTMRMKDE